MTQPYRGTVRNVKDRQFGSELDGDHAAGATSLTVVWTNDFNADGGQLYFKDADGNVGETITYTIPVDADGITSETQINLGAALANSYTSGTKVWVYPAKVERIAYFMEPNGTKPLEARVPHHLKPLLTPGGRTDDTAEQIELEERGTQQVVLDVLAEPLQFHDLELSSGQIGGVRVLRDGIVYAYVQAQLDTAGQNLLDVAVFDGDGAAGDVAALRVIAPTNNTPSSAYGVTAIAGANAAQVLAGDDTSDFEFDTSAGWQNWTPTFTGYSANPASGVYRYKQTGKTVQLVLRQPNNGTSNSVSKSISLPVTAATISGMEWRAACGAVDNGVALATPARARIASAGTVINFDKDYSATDGWTPSGNHRITGLELFYEAA